MFDLAVLIVVGVALLLRLATLPVLVRAQTATRRRALAAAGVDASAGAPGGLGATIGEVAVGLLCAVGLQALMFAWFNHGFIMLRQHFYIDNARYLAIELHLARGVARIWYLVPFIGCLVLWLLLWYLTQRNLLTVGMPRQAWYSGPTQLRIVGLVALRAAIGVFLLPVGLIIAALLFQIVAVLVSRRPRTVGAEADQLPPPNPYAATVPPQGYVPTQYAPPAPQYAPPAPQYVPPAQPVQPPATPVPPAATPTPPLARHPLSPHEPRTIGGYQLLGRIGSGGMGTVYLAQRQGSATQVALKTINLELLNDAELLRRFQRESEVLAMVPGAYTARVLDAGVDAGRPYLAMELLDGQPLDAHLREQGPIRSPEALRALALALAVALSGVHRLGLVHRDLKPANIMLTTAGPRLLDFGIAAIVDGTRLTVTGGGPGTLTYMAPEQFGDERVGTAADVWAWACCVVCAAHGASPFAATSTGAVIRRIVDTGPEPAALAAVQAIDPALAAVVTQALAIDPAQRPADGAGLLAALTTQQAVPREPAAVHDQITRGWQTLAL
ncbi:serine/threonine protein kinase [Kitasatospora aureofaciens]|uniref:serine/threonine-protein kinase n=1 Tax=Kitasatospora aureofaciens TaxID=1894 RepID=UPI001C443A4F|nr:serine/threonine-protein kinase [Kitasatospora aureofaciens]MBV6699637.1 serine/threonine protein kinase [Kitasatospora aureofaciens]